MGGRWASFDCYGTLVDWNAGIASVLGAGLLGAYHELEPRLQAEDSSRSYRQVLTLAGDTLAGRGRELADSLPSWPPFPDTRPALEELRARGWKLAILSNTDPDYLAASVEAIGVPFDLTITASELGSYKPGHAHFEALRERARPDRHVHVAQSRFHDVEPAAELGIPVVWINRLGEDPDPRADRELPGLAGLAGVLEEL